MTDDYDGNLDAYLSWQWAIDAIRKAKILAGEFEPINAAEWELLINWLDEKGKS